MDESLVIDMSKVRADLAAAEAELRAGEEAVVEAQSRIAAAKGRYEMLRNMVAAMSKWAVTQDGKDGQVITTMPSPAIRRESGPLAGLSGALAAKRYVEMNAGGFVKLDAIYRDMVTMGFEGTENAVSVSFANLAKDGEVERVKRGYYRLAPPAKDAAAQPMRPQPVPSESPDDGPKVFSGGQAG